MIESEFLKVILNAYSGGCDKVRKMMMVVNMIMVKEYERDCERDREMVTAVKGE